MSAPLLAGAYACRNVRENLRPPNYVQTFEDYIGQFGEPDTMYVRQSQNGPHLFVTRSIPLHWYLVLPDGVPTYVFDCHGRLVDWSPYSCDDSAFQNRWPSVERMAGPAIGVTHSKAREWFE